MIYYIKVINITKDHKNHFDPITAGGCLPDENCFNAATFYDTLHFFLHGNC